MVAFISGSIVCCGIASIRITTSLRRCIGMQRRLFFFEDDCADMSALLPKGYWIAFVPHSDIDLIAFSRQVDGLLARQSTMSWRS